MVGTSDQSCWLAKACKILLLLLLLLLLGCGRCCGGSDWALAGHRFWQSVLSLCSPHSRPLSQGVVLCTYEQWFKPYSPRRRYCQLPVSGRRMQQFLQFRPGCHGLATATGPSAGAGHIDRANRICLTCNSGAMYQYISDIGNEMFFECTALAPLRQQHADRFTPHTDTMRSF